MNYIKCSRHEKPEEFKHQYLSSNKIIKKYVWSFSFIKYL